MNTIRKPSTLVALAMAALISSGCTYQQRLKLVAHDAVNYYCAVPMAERQAVRDLIDAQTTPHKIRVLCQGETETTDGAAQ